MRSTSDEARRVYLISMRKRLGLTQGDMAGALGMSLRSYSDLETGASRCRTVHVLAAERLTLREAAGRGDTSVLAGPVEKDLAAVALAG